MQKSLLSIFLRARDRLERGKEKMKQNVEEKVQTTLPRVGLPSHLEALRTRAGAYEAIADTAWRKFEEAKEEWLTSNV